MTLFDILVWIMSALFERHNYPGDKPGLCLVISYILGLIATNLNQVRAMLGRRPYASIFVNLLAAMSWFCIWDLLGHCEYLVSGLLVCLTFVGTAFCLEKAVVQAIPQTTAAAQHSVDSLEGGAIHAQARSTFDIRAWLNHANLFSVLEFSMVAHLLRSGYLVEPVVPWLVVAVGYSLLLMSTNINLVPQMNGGKAYYAIGLNFLAMVSWFWIWDVLSIGLYAFTDILVCLTAVVSAICLEKAVARR